MRSRLLLAFAVIYTLANAGGLIFAAASREPGHAALHAALLIPIGWLLSRRVSRDATGLTRGTSPDAAFPSRLTNLEQSLDAVAIEVDRIVEGQRNLTTLLADVETRRAAGQPAAGEIGKDRSSS